MDTLFTSLEDAQIQSLLAQEMEVDDSATLEALLQTADVQEWGSVYKFFKNVGKKGDKILKRGTKEYLNNPLASNQID